MKHDESKKGSMMKKYIDLSHRMYNGMLTYPGYPGITINTYLGRKETGKRFGEKAAAQIDHIDMINCSGTYLDAPYHVREDGYKVADIPLSKVADLDYTVIELQSGKDCFDVEELKGKCIKGGAVLLYTGDYEKFGTPEYGTDNPPYLTEAGAKYLMEQGVVFVGIDTALIDCMYHQDTWGIPVHYTILDAGGVVCEDMNNLKEAIPYAGKGKLYAAPLKVEMSSVSTRPYIVVNE